MRIAWNTVTWYSKLLAVVVLALTIGIGFYLGTVWQQVRLERMYYSSAPPHVTTQGGNGAHCGGFIKDAPTCGPGYECVTTPGEADTGGTCAPVGSSLSGGATSTVSTTTPAWAADMQILTPSSHGTITLAKHERFALRLGNDLKWTYTFAPTGVVTRVPNTTTADGFQGVFEAVEEGTTTLTAEGRPDCKAHEMCAQFIVQVTVTIVVQ